MEGRLCDCATLAMMSGFSTSVSVRGAPSVFLIFSADADSGRESATAAAPMNTSAPADSASACSHISVAEVTGCTVTRSGASKCTGPEINSTCAPASAQAPASAKPIFPELWLLKYRTGSMASMVGPAVITTRRPSSSRLLKRALTAATMASGSSSRPGPTSPQACSPASGPII